MKPSSPPRPLWLCRGCDYAWFPKKPGKPERCPSCRSRKWVVRREVGPQPMGEEVPTASNAKEAAT